MTTVDDRAAQTARRDGRTGPEPHDLLDPGHGAALSIRGASKTYGDVRVLHDVHLTLKAGEVHALVGQNGSGKSTLVKVLSGLVAPDAGAELAADGVAITLPSRPDDLNAHGISFVHQDLGLIGDATVVENIRMGRLRRHPITRRIQWSGEVERAQQTLVRLHSDIDPRSAVDELKPGQRGLVAIARALQTHTGGGGCIVFDESTQSLPRESLAEFYEIVDQLAAEGTAVLLVSHRLDEVLRLAGRVTVLRDGRVTAAGVATQGMTEPRLAALVLGREVVLDELPKASDAVLGSPATFTGRGIRGRDLDGLDLDVRPGEIVGITGSTGAGHEELASVLGGSAELASGDLTMPDGTIVHLRTSTIAEHLSAGMAVVPEQRAREGLALEMSALENLTLPRLPVRSGRLRLSRGWQDEEFAEMVALLGIVPPSPDLLVGSFSGGNQQKILLGKWLLNRPSVLVLHEPTQAVDVGARVDILRAVRGVADAGAAVVICSVEAQDLAYVCDRVLVLRAGQVHRELDADLDPQQILDAL